MPIFDKNTLLQQIEEEKLTTVDLSIYSSANTEDEDEKNSFEREMVLNGHKGCVRAFVTLPDGHFASASEDKTIKVWDPTTGQCVLTLEGHKDAVLSLAVSLDGKILFSGSKDKTIKAWIPGGKCIATMEGHEQ